MARRFEPVAFGDIPVREIGPVADWTDSLELPLYNERLRPPRRHGPHDGLDRRSQKLADLAVRGMGRSLYVAAMWRLLDTLQRNRGVSAQAKCPLALRLAHDREPVQRDDGSASSGTREKLLARHARAPR